MNRDIELLQNKALETAQRLIDYDSYGKNEAKAIAALKKKCPDMDKELYELWFKKAVAAHKDALVYVKQNSEQAWDLYKQNQEKVNLLPMAEVFHENHPEFTVEQLHGTLGFIFYYWHLR
jgi:hypothetical protein